jgi:2-polyprenyl-6-methoxyphenol hydroxylase and related FAD-dependent oxidoreductases
MKKQKICIIGGSLTGLITSIALSKLNCEIDIITGSTNAKLKSSRTTAISQNNLEFLNELDISNLLKKELWACTNMKLYTENHNKKTLELLDFNINKVNKKVLYMMENKKIKNILMNQIKKNKLISLIKNKNISQINDSGILKSVKLEKKFIKYNLIIICTGNNSALVKNFFKDQIIEDSYNEMSLTAVLKHDTLKNDTARQFFYNKEILALLPISNTRTSVVYFIKKNNKQNNLFYKNKIKNHMLKNYFKKYLFLNQTFDMGKLNFLKKKNYFKDRNFIIG